MHIYICLAYISIKLHVYCILIYMSWGLVYIYFVYKRIIVHAFLASYYNGDEEDRTLLPSWCLGWGAMDAMISFTGYGQDCNPVFQKKFAEMADLVLLVYVRQGKEIDANKVNVFRTCRPFCNSK